MTSVLGFEGSRLDYFYLNSSRALVHATVPATFLLTIPPGRTGEVLGGEYLYNKLFQELLAPSLKE